MFVSPCHAWSGELSIPFLCFASPNPPPFSFFPPIQIQKAYALVLMTAECAALRTLLWPLSPIYESSNPSLNPCLSPNPSPSPSSSPSPNPNPNPSLILILNPHSPTTNYALSTPNPNPNSTLTLTLTLTSTLSTTPTHHMPLHHRFFCPCYSYGQSMEGTFGE
jgi:hypothetical protein